MTTDTPINQTSGKTGVPTRDMLTQRNHVRITGSGPVLMFAHGLGCDQRTWQRVTPTFAASHQIVLFDHVGSGRSDRTAYRHDKYQTLLGYAADVVALMQAFDLRDVVFVGHSVSAMIGLLAAIQAPERVKALVMIGPSPRHVNDGDYIGGFTRADVMELLQTMTLNYATWIKQMVPMVIATEGRPDLNEELASSFVQTDPVIMRHFAETSFLSDVRAILPLSPVPSLILHSRNDVIAPLAVGDYLQRHLPHSTRQLLQATGHYPHLSAPEEVIGAIRAYLAQLDRQATSV